MDDNKIRQYLERLHKRGANTLQAFEKNLDFVIATKSEIGQDLLKDLLARHEYLFSRIASLEATNDDKAAYVYIKTMLDAWARRIADYERSVREVEEIKSADALRKE